MQQYTRDLWRGVQVLYGDRAVLVGPVTGMGFLLFPFVAVVRGIAVARRGGIVHVGDLALAPIARVIRFFVPGGKITATAFGLDVVYPPRWYQWLLRRSVSAIDRIVCISQETAHALRERGVREEAITVIPCGIWMEARTMIPQQRRGGELRLLSIGRLVPRKGVAWFVSQVLPLLLRENPGLTLAIVGTGPEERLIKKIIQDKGLVGAVLLMGALNDDEREKILRASDLLIVPNVPVSGDREGFGIVCIEAGSRGVPVAAARLEGLKDAVIDGETGRFFRPGDPEDSAKVIRELLLRPLDPERLIRSTREHYGWEHLIQRYHRDVFTA